MIYGEPRDFWGDPLEKILILKPTATARAKWRNRFATTLEAEPLEINAPADKDLPWGVVQEGPGPHRIDVRHITIADVFIHVHDGLSEDVADTAHQPHTVGELDVAEMTVGESGRQGVIPQPDRAQGPAPSVLYRKMIKKRFETVKRFILAIVSHAKDVQMDVQVRLKGLCGFPRVD